MFSLSMENLIETLNITINCHCDLQDNMPPDMEQRLQRILSDAYSLQAEYEETVFSLPVSVLSTSDLNEMSSDLSLYKERRLSESDNESTTDSFVSATEVSMAKT